MNIGNQVTDPITGKVHFDGAHGTKRTVREPWTPGKNRGCNFGAKFGGVQSDRCFHQKFIKVVFGRRLRKKVA
jgi:hypothetical protein